MKSTPFRRAVAVVLCLQPTFWMGGVAYAQMPEQRPQLPGGYLDPSQSPSSSSDQPGLSSSLPPAFSTPGGSVADERSAPRPLDPVPPPVDAPLDPDKYVCGSGDVLMVNFWGVQNVKMRVIIDLEGRAFVPKVGYLPLQGKTLTEARRVMRESVARYFPRLSFDVALSEPRTFLVQVVDDVALPASYPARATDRVASIIARAGGFGKKASKRRIEIRRRDGSVLQADLVLYALTGDIKHNPYLLDGDVVRVPFEDLAASIDGAVNRPGRYELTGTRDLAELMELAGGLGPTATRLMPVSVVRRLPDDKQTQLILPFTPEGALPSAPVQHEDGVIIPSFTDLQQSVMVIGAIKGATASPLGPGAAAPDEPSATRRLPFVQGDSVRTVLERVGGVGPLADLNGSFLLRGGQALPVDLYALVMLRDLKADRPLELGDTLVVPFKRRNILVEGAVFKPGAYPYNPNFGIDQYLSLAGGPNRFAESLTSVRVVMPDGQMAKYERNMKLEPGSSLVVPERNFSRAEVVQLIIGAASVIVSGVAVVLAARK